MALADIIRELRSTTEGVAAYNLMHEDDCDASLTIHGDLPPALVPYADRDGHLTLRGGVTTLRLLAALLEEKE
jgi:hypothetical protein